MLKKIILISLLALLIGSAPVHAGKIEAGTAANWPPMEFIDTSTQAIIGFSVDYMAALAQEMKTDYEFINVEWDEIFSGLISRKYDIIFSSVTVTEERKTMFNFTESYMVIHQALVTRQSGPDLKLADLAGKPTGSLQYSTGYYVAREMGAKGRYYTEMDMAMDDLINGEIVAVICDSPVAAYFVHIHTGYEGSLQISDYGQDAEEVAIVVPKENSQLLQELNQAIETIRANGTEKIIFEKWMGKEIAPRLTPE